MDHKLTTKELCDADQMHAIIRGIHDNPYGFLGVHQLETGGFVVRAFIPAAEKVELVHRKSHRRIAEMVCLDDAGFFIADLQARKRAPLYQYKVWYKGHKKAVFVDDIYTVPLLLGDDFLWRFTREDVTNTYAYLGAHAVTIDGVPGMRFAVWAPNARRVAVVGEFNHWDGRRHIMRKRIEAGIFEAFIPGLVGGELYKYEIQGADGGLLPLKADPYARQGELRPANASVTCTPSTFQWTDSDWMHSRSARQHREAAISVYEVHLGSWRKDGDDFLDYRMLAKKLIPYVKALGFTHIQLMPVTEYPYDGSWGYQPTGLFAPTARFGSLDDFKYFINACHQQSIGVFFDWVPAHFPLDPHGLAQFDGTALFEHADPRQGYHPDWNTAIFNFGRQEVVNYLLSSALFWLKEFHIDGIRVDAVSSMLYLNYSREDGEWIPNKHGGHENLEAISFLQRFNTYVYGQTDGAITIAEESTAWPGITTPVDCGGLGFGFKWNMGWMNDSLEYMTEDPIHRPYHHDKMTLSITYAFSENFVLPLSHDEVVHGKGSILGRMPGDEWQRHANLRAYYAFMWMHPGKKLLFMGSEFGQSTEWDYNKDLDWWLLDHDVHRNTQNLIADLNTLYCRLPALYTQDCSENGFQWMQWNASETSIFAFIRRGHDSNSAPVLVVSNMTPVVREGYRIGVPHSGTWELALNTDGLVFGGSGTVATEHALTQDHAHDGQPHSIQITCPPLSTVVYVLE